MSTITIQLLRHATLLLSINNQRILVDPMLSKRAAMDPVPMAANEDRIPLVDLPLSDTELATLLNDIDAVIITHTHRDHWDAAAQEKIAKDKIIFCQPIDVALIQSQGFTRVQPIESNFIWNDISIHRTNGQHGTGEIGQKMGTVSGFVLTYGEQRLYLTGDTIWCSDVEDAITTHLPTHIIVNGGGAQFVQGDPITMTINDVLAVAQFTEAPIQVVHLETVNHCYQRRPDFKAAIEANNLQAQISVPDDGASWSL
ncbi:L-ascorbate metabolism protein UlaG, beta-lactamase superfamily [Chitinophaga rupis]|uniref:L-ascorbate metabolism protein UlaG, beta-lactamase superfamily n=1 Tax=Chitinophaga rupis TaxID=573321 RepID=A0A1H8IZA1_9BACT|nr:MBL fold metallo-hydrolase [Chitinophaga rupis]SEN73247.1 L-ascorbate metabolism protein UlaG, beta-lactamase superfamily [Chitinophaga rupis]